MTLTVCPDCGTRRVIVHAGQPHARIRTHQATNPTTRAMQTCPGSGKKPGREA